jgi:hypothetical protein
MGKILIFRAPSVRSCAPGSPPCTGENQNLSNNGGGLYQVTPQPKWLADIAKAEWIGEIPGSNPRASHFWCMVTTLYIFGWWFGFFIWLSLESFGGYG